MTEGGGKGEEAGELMESEPGSEERGGEGGGDSRVVRVEEEAGRVMAKEDEKGNYGRDGE